MKKVLTATVKWLTAILCVLSTAFAAFQTLLIADTGFERGQAYTPEIIASRLREIAPMLGLFAVFALIGLVFLPETKPRAKGMKNCTHEEGKGIPVIRWVVLVTAIILLIFGICDGGMRDVFAKAVNICTECIGLG